ncbi:MAG: transposase, partial [Planctomycetaceae bacterium]|nr:transposase [Planctomycetaceae bacterium]
MSLEWIEREFKTVSFNDQRLDHRFMQILGAFSSHPTLSIP